MRHLTLETSDHVATVWLDRPDKRNAVNLDMFDDLAACAQQLAAAPDLRAVVLAGRGDAFCAGLDVSLFQELDPTTLGRDLEPVAGSPANRFQAAACMWRELPVPVICALHGVVFGAGLQIALGADIRIAEPTTRLSVMEIRWGLVPDMGLSVTARGRVAVDVLFELACTGRVIDAPAALAAGLVTRLDEDPAGAARALAAAVAARSPDAIRALKCLLRDGWLASVPDALALEARLQGGLIGRSNQREAVRANSENREPAFAPASELCKRVPTQRQ